MPLGISSSSFHRSPNSRTIRLVGIRRKARRREIQTTWEARMIPMVATKKLRPMQVRKRKCGILVQPMEG